MLEGIPHAPGSDEKHLPQFSAEDLHMEEASMVAEEIADLAVRLTEYNPSLSWEDAIEKLQGPTREQDDLAPIWAQHGIAPDEQKEILARAKAKWEANRETQH